MSLCEWDIDGIFTLTVDNASSNLTTIKFLQRVAKDWNEIVFGNEFMHMRCCAHILYLIVGEGLKEIDASVAKAREAVRYVKFSPNRNQTFSNFMERLGMVFKSLLSLDVPTRWNLTYIMLEIAKKFEKVFLRMDFEDDGYSSYFRTKEDSGGLGSPCMSDFQNCRASVTFLRLFFNFFRGSRTTATYKRGLILSPSLQYFTNLVFLCLWLCFSKGCLNEKYSLE